MSNVKIDRQFMPTRARRVYATQCMSKNIYIYTKHIIKHVY